LGPLAHQAFNRRPDGIPQSWLARGNRSTRPLIARFIAERMPRDFVVTLYTPA
jgi:hypothetical protein